MKKAIALVAAIGVIGFFAWRGQDASSPASKDVPARPLSQRADSTVAAMPSPNPPSDGKALSAEEVLQAYKCKELDELKCDYAVTGAISAEEAQWLRQMGYPSAEQIESMKTMPLSELKRRAEANDRIAGVFYGKKLIESGQGLQGLGAMNNALIHGSVYANYAMAEALLDKNSGVTDRTEGKARLRLAYLLGDWKASYPLASSLDQYSGIVEIGVIDRRAMRLYEGLLSAKRRANQPILLALRPTSKDHL